MPSEFKINLTLNQNNTLDVDLIRHLGQFNSGTGQYERASEIKRLLRIGLLSEAYPIHTERKIRPYFADELFPRRGPAHDYVDDVPVTSRQVATTGTDKPMPADESAGADRVPTLTPAVQKPAATMPAVRPAVAVTEQLGTNADEDEIPMGLAFLQNLPPPAVRDLSE